MISQSTAILILGMHRSGTSSLAGSLQQNGLFLGEVFEKNPHNPKGNRENKEIMELNNALLIHNGGNWYTPPETIQWDETLVNDRDRIINNFISSKEKMWGFKDPRTIITLPFWLDALTNIKMVGVFRHPLLVTESLHARTPEMPINYGMQLWKRYNAQLLLYFKQKEFPLLSFDVSPEEFNAAIKSTVTYLGLPGIQQEGEEQFFDESLKKQNAVENEEEIPKDIIQLYTVMKNIYTKQFLS